MKYDWRIDSYLSWALAIRMMALAVGSRQFETVAEMYFCEARGVIP